MEIKLKNEVFTNGFMGVIQKLLAKDMVATYADAFVLGKFADEMDRNAKIFQNAHGKLIKEFANKNKKGEVLKLPACSKCGAQYKKGNKKKTCLVKFRGVVCGGEIVKEGRTDIPKKNVVKAEEAFIELKGVEGSYELVRKITLKEDGEKLVPSEVRLVGEILELDLKEDAK